MMVRKNSQDSGPDGGTHFGRNDPNSPLNPSSTNFDPRAWTANLAKLKTEQGQGFRHVGLCFQDLSVFGYHTPADFQKTVANIWLALPGIVTRKLLPKSITSAQMRVDILHDFSGLIRPGEMCVVLGPPGSGCSTFLKTISGDRDGFEVDKKSYFNYHGITDTELHTAHRGDALYTADVDVHFPNLTVGETLTFAANACCAQEIPPGITRNE